MNSNLFVKKYRPKTFDKVVLTARLKTHFPDGKITKHLLLFGDSGMGKSVVLSVISKEYNTLYINASADTGIDILREGGDVYNHCSEFSFDDRQKLVFLDEVDGVSIQFFKALKGFMDVFENTLFVATTNFIEDIPKAHMSRFEMVDFSFKDENERKEFFIGYRNRLYVVAKNEGIESEMKSITAFSEKYFPDFRDALQDLQRLKENGVKELTDEVLKHDVFEYAELFKIMLFSNVSEIEKIHQAVTSIKNPKDCIRKIDLEFFEYVKANSPENLVKCGNVIIQTANHSNMLSNRINPTLVLKSLVFTVINILR